MSGIRPPRVPHPVIGHVALPIGKRMLVWGGYTTAEDTIEQDGIMFQMNPYVDPALVWIYDPDGKKWEALQCSGDVPLGTSGARAAVMDSTLLLFGGFNQFGHTSDLYHLDLRTLCWTFIDCADRADQPSPRDKFMCWTHDDSFYVFGGFGVNLTGYLHDNGTFTVDDDLLEPSTHGWNNQLCVHKRRSEKLWTNPKCTGAIPSPRAAAAAARLGPLVYMFGGRHLQRRLNDLYSLDLHTLDWTRLHPVGSDAVPCGRSWHTLTPISGCQLLLYGGYTQDQKTLNDRWVLDVRRLEWRPVDCDPPPPCRLWHSTCCTDLKDVIVFGGCSNNIKSNVAKCHNEVFLFQFQPQSLLRLCLSVVDAHRGLLEHDLSSLPAVLLRQLDQRLPAPAPTHQAPGDSGEESAEHARTCVVS